MRTSETLGPFKPSTITIKKVANDWFVAFSYEVNFPTVAHPISSVGVDLGIKSLATLSTEEVVEGPKSYALRQKRLIRLQRRLSRKVKGSLNRDKARQKVAQLHARIANIRKDSLHKLTTMICKNHAVKLEKFGNKLVLINRWFPSSKKCSCCGHIKDDLTLSDRIYECSECSLVIDRDLNAALNIDIEALRILALESA